MNEVNMVELTHFVDERGTSYASVADSVKALKEEMHSLYLLSFLLTADPDKAERCLVSAIGECVEGMGAYMDWARLWTRRSVLNHAIQMIMPTPERAIDVPFISLKGPSTTAENNYFAEILLLDPFERFVFVMSVLEGQSDEECAILLKCSRREVMMARILALQCQVSISARSDEILLS
jgi:hypothetical protein